MGKKQLENLVAFDYDRDGNLVIVFHRGLFEAINVARKQGLIEEQGDEVRIAFNADNLGYRLKGLQFVAMTDQPDCDA